MTLSNYPPGVTGLEPQIIGFPPCGFCGHQAEDHNEDEVCEVDGCVCSEYDQYAAPDEDPDWREEER